MGRTQKLNPSLWKRNVIKFQRAKGEECMRLRNNRIKKRITGPYNKCKLLLMILL